MVVATFLVALCYAGIHLWIGQLNLSTAIPHRVWLSMAGGVAVAYVFMHILPDLAAHRESFAKGLGVGMAAAEMIVFSVALAGLVAFFGLERLVVVARHRAGGDAEVGNRVFWAHLGAFAAYNFLIGYLLVERAAYGASALALYGVAMGMHFLTADIGLREHHMGRYDRTGRWILAAAILAGWGMGQMVDLPPIGIGILFALLAGATILNILKEELPAERQGRFWAFLLGAGGYSVLLALA